MPEPPRVDSGLPAWVTRMEALAAARDAAPKLIVEVWADGRPPVFRDGVTEQAWTGIERFHIDQPFLGLATVEVIVGAAALPPLWPGRYYFEGADIAWRFHV